LRVRRTNVKSTVQTFLEESDSEQLQEVNKVKGTGRNQRDNDGMR